MNYQIEHLSEFTITGVRKRVITEKAFEIIPKIWEDAGNNGTMQQLFELLHQYNGRPAGLLGASALGNWGSSEEMDYYLAVTTGVKDYNEENKIVDENFNQLTIPSATWVIFEANGPLPDSIQKIYKQFYSEWLPNSGYQLEDLPVIESYLPENKQEVWIAIKK